MRPPPAKLSINAPYSNKDIQDEIYSSYIKITWTNLEGPLLPKLLYYSHIYLQLGNGLITTPKYNLFQMSHDLRFSLARLWVCSHQLDIETYHHLPREKHISKLYSLEVECDEYFIFTCHFYYQIHGRYYCLFKDAYTLNFWFNCDDQRCVSLLIYELFNLRKFLLNNSSKKTIRSKLILSFLQPHGGSSKKHQDNYRYITRLICPQLQQSSCRIISNSSIIHFFLALNVGSTL